MMQHYMVKLYDATGGFVGRVEFNAADDGAATRVVRGLKPGRSQELWSGKRWIASWPARETLAAVQ